jgi:hypothetical protein
MTGKLIELPRRPSVSDAPRFRQVDARLDDRGALVCPVCGEGTLHQVLFEVWRRCEDKSGDSIASSARTAGAIVSCTPRSSEAFPRGTRRQSMRLHFTCEACHDDPRDDPGYVLVIYQHKGSTLLVWELS